MQAEYEFLNLCNCCLTKEKIHYLKEKAKFLEKKTFRYNLHENFEDPLQEMIICTYLKKDNQHRHKNKYEVLHIIEGELMVKIFNEANQLEETLTLTPGTSHCFVRIKKGSWHSTVPVGEFAIFHEVAQGPFQSEDIEYYDQ